MPNISQHNLRVPTVWKSKTLDANQTHQDSTQSEPHARRIFSFASNLIRPPVHPAHENKPASKIEEVSVHNSARTAWTLGKEPPGVIAKCRGFSGSTTSPTERPLHPAPDSLLPLQRRVRLSPCLKSSWSFVYSSEFRNYIKANWIKLKSSLFYHLESMFLQMYFQLQMNTATDWMFVLAYSTPNSCV